MIFHLKRFEFDLHTMVRSKINDMFEFPDRIDMRPYTVEYLSDSESSSPDLFELTGVLVHNGTAESGHYYSYIKDRQKRSDQDTPVWFDFNDSEVSAFDPSTIAGLCYGGTDFIGPTKEINQQIAFSKTYSAYMLFYERVNPKVSRSTDSHISRKVPIPKELEIQIFQENEATVRKYCLFDPSHLAFTTNILRQSHAFKIAEPTDENEFVARNALYLALKTYEQIGSRMKDSPEAEELISTIKGFFQSKCIDCCNNFLHWICQPTDSLRLLLLRSSNPRVREHTATMIHYALVQIRKYGGDSYGRIEQNGNDIIDIEGNLHKVVEALLSLWGHLPVLFRNWDEYLALVQNIADLGSMERHLLLRWGVLRKAFILFMPDHLPLDREMKLQHSNLLRWGERIKRPSYTNLLELIHALISHCELVHEPCVDEDTRLPMVNSKFLLSQYEKHCLAHSHKKDTELVNSFLFKQVELNSNPVATEHFIRMILTLEPDPFVNGLVSSFKLALLNGICLDPADEAGPSLAGLFTYCCYSREPNHIKEIIRRVADEVPTIHMRGGREHLDFFRSLWIHGRNANMKPSFIYLRVLENMHLWAPPLLVYWDPAIRIDTENLIFDKVIKLRGEGQDSRRDRIENALMKLPEACFSFVENKYLKSKDLQGSTDDKSFDSLIRILESCPRLDMSEDPDYHARIDGNRSL